MVGTDCDLGPSAVNGIANLKVSATLTNTGDETLKVLNDPLSPLSTIPANTFAITNADGSSPNFAGVKAKFVPQRAAELGSYVTLAPGESKTVEHDRESPLLGFAHDIQC